MDKVLREILIDIASKRGTITYRELAKNYETINYKIGKGETQKYWDALTLISEYEVKEGNDRPLLSVVVISGGVNGMPGKGFFQLFPECPKTGFDKGTKKDLFNSEKKKCHDFWSNKDNYSKYKVIKE